MIASSILDVKAGGKERLPGEVAWFLGVDSRFTGGWAGAGDACCRRRMSEDGGRNLISASVFLFPWLLLDNAWSYKEQDFLGAARHGGAPEQVADNRQ